MPARFYTASVLAILLLLVYCTGLTSIGMFGPDEPRYAAIGVAMADTGDWITPRLWGQPWFEKSPLVYWMTGLATKLGLGPDLAPRLPVALTAVALSLFLYLYLRTKLSEAIALRTAVLTAASGGWLAFGSVGVTDVPLAASVTVCVLLSVFGGSPWVAGVFLGLAALAKGLVPLVLVAPLAWWLYRERRLRDLLPMAIACLVVAGPWYAAVTWINGRAFFDEFILKHHFARFSNDSLQHVRPFWFYLPVLAGFLIPWAGLVPLGFGAKVRTDARLQFLAVWFLFGFLFFSASRNKLPGYILPLVPVLCLLIAAAMEQYSRLAVAILTATAALLAGGLAMALPRVDASTTGAWREFAPVSASSVGLALAAALISAMICWKLREDRKLWWTAGLIFAAVLWLKAGPTGTQLDPALTARPLSRTADRIAGCVHPGDRDLRYGLSYYWRFEVPECNDDTLPRRIRRPLSR